MGPERNQLLRAEPIAPSPSSDVAGRQIQQDMLADWGQLGLQQVVPSPLAERPLDHIDLKPPPLESDRKKEKKKRVIHEWARGIWMRRALLRTRDKARERSDKSQSSTARNLWKVADVAIGLVLSAPNKSIIVPRRRSRSMRRYDPEEGVSA